MIDVEWGGILKNSYGNKSIFHRDDPVRTGYELGIIILKPTCSNILDGA